MDKKEITKQKATAYYSRIFEAYNQLRRDVMDILEDMGGFIKTLPSRDGRMVATMEDYSANRYSETVYGVRLVDGNILICTETSIKNYEFDNDYRFDDINEFIDGTEDMKNIEKLVNDTAYYIDIDEDYVDTRETLYCILAGLGDYLED